VVGLYTNGAEMQSKGRLAAIKCSQRTPALPRLWQRSCWVLHRSEPCSGLASSSCLAVFLVSNGYV